MVAEDVQYPVELVEEVFEMPLAQPVGGAPLYEPLARVLADRLEEAVPPLTGDIVLDTDEGFADQLRQEVEHVAGVDPITTTDLLIGLERPPGWEHGQAAEQVPFVIRQQLVAPVHGRFERPLSGHRRPHAAGEQAESVLQPRVDLLQ